MALQTFFAQIIAKELVASHMLQIRFAKPEGFEYQAGQFLQLLVPPGATPRSYSLSSTPTDDYLEFGVKLYEGGLASEYFQTLTVGDQVELKGPLGRFINTQRDPIVGIATGAGLVPIYGIFHDELMNKKNQAPMHLIFGVRTEADLFWLDRLEALASSNSNFTYIYTLSQPSENWKKTRGRVSEHITLLPEARYFICGNPEMVKDVRGQLLEKAVPVTNIHLEIF